MTAGGTRYRRLEGTICYRLQKERGQLLRRSPAPVDRRSLPRGITAFGNLLFRLSEHCREISAGQSRTSSLMKQAPGGFGTPQHSLFRRCRAAASAASCALPVSGSLFRSAAPMLQFTPISRLSLQAFSHYCRRPTASVAVLHDEAGVNRFAGGS